MKRSFFLTAVLFLIAPSARAQSASDIAASQVLFDQARELSKQAKWEEACTKYDESQRLSPTINTQYYLADCQEHVGKTASAWANYVAAADKAKAAKETAKEDHARKRAAALLPKLCKLELRVSPVEGLMVRRNGVEVSKAQWGSALPVDPGTYAIEASATGSATWSKSVSLVAGTCEGRVESIEVPKLEKTEPSTTEPPKAPVEPPKAAEPPKATTPVIPPKDTAPEEPRPGRLQKAIALVVGGVGVVGIGVGLGLRASGRSQYDDAIARCTLPGPNPCSDADADDALAGRDRKNLGWIVAGTGGAMVAGGIVLWLTAKAGTHGTESHALVTPWVGTSVSGIRVVARF